MNRKDFELIAEAVRVTYVKADESEIGIALLNDLISNLCANLRQTNPKFDAIRFARTCRGGNYHE